MILPFSIWIIANVALCIGIIVIILSLMDTNDKLSKYRDLQNKQIASVKELCLDVGTTNSILHDNYSQDRMELSLIVTVFAKDEYSSLYNSTYANICFKPLALISGKEFESAGTPEEKTKSLLKEETKDSPKYSIADNAFDGVKW